MSTAADVRKIALSFDGTREIDHFARPAFRTAKRIFAVIRPDGLWLYLPPDRKDFLFAAEPETFVRYLWGKTPELLVQLDRVGRKELKVLLEEAWTAAQPPAKPGRRRTAPKRVSSKANR